MAEIQQLIFDIVTRDRASEGFAKAGKAASAAAGNVDTLTRRLDEVGRKSATARVQLAGNAEAQAALDKMDARLISLDRRTASPNLTVEGAARALAEISAIDVAMGKLSHTTDDTGTSALGLGANIGKLSNLAMPALIGAGVALSPVIATLGTGMAGFGAAAVGVIKPITDAAQKTGGLRANMAGLSPVQRGLAGELLGLGHDYTVFSKSLQPEVVSAFGTAIHIAGNVLHDVQPVALATGKSFDALLGQFGATLQNPQWRQFWAFMAKTAPTDMRLLGNVIIDLTNDLPALLEGLQPVAQGFLVAADDGAKFFGVIGKGLQDISHPKTNTGFWSGTLWDKLVGGAKDLAGIIPHTSNSILGMAQAADKATSSGSTASATVRQFGITTESAGTVVKALSHQVSVSTGTEKVWSVTLSNATIAASAQKTAVTLLTGALNKQITPLLALQSDQVAWKQAQQAATQALDQNKHSLDSNRASALAARQAVIQSTQAAIQFASQEVTLHGRVGAASDVLRAQIGWLQQHAGHSRVARQEIDALRAALARLPRNVHSLVTVTESFHGKVTYADQIAGQRKPGGFLEFHAAGGKIPGFGGGDQHLALLEAGEAVVDKDRTRKFAPVLRAMGVPGMAAGGLAGSNIFTGPQWGAHVTGRWAGQVSKAWADAARAAAKAAAARMFAVSGAGPAGGDARVNEALARRMFPWPSWMWPSYVALEMMEAGFNRFARNPSSGAYGIPQALPPTKMPFSAQAAGGSHAGPQISWMYGYIGGRYGNPVNALAHERAFHWYDDGGVMPPGLSLAYNGTGAPEPLVPAARAGTVIVNINVTPTPLARPADIGREIARVLAEFKKHGGMVYAPAGF